MKFVPFQTNLQYNRGKSISSNRETLQLAKILDAIEATWMAEQEMLSGERVRKLRQLADTTEELKRTLLLRCKYWRGPNAPVDELQDVISSAASKKQLKTMLRTEIQYPRKTISYETFKKYTLNNSIICESKQVFVFVYYILINLPYFFLFPLVLT